MSFDLNGGGGDAPVSQNIGHGHKATEPTSRPTREGYSFTGWYTTKTNKEGSSFSFDTPITGSLTLYAGWTPEYHVVTFVTQDSDSQKDQVVAHDQKATRPTEDPARSGWYWLTKDGYLRERYDFDNIPDKDITLYARYEKCVVAFDAAGGTPQPEAQTVEYDTSPTKPAEDPTKDGFTFDGWYLEGEDEPFEFGVDTITDDTTLHARWIEAKEWQSPVEEPTILSVVFDSNGGSAVTPQSQKVAFEQFAQKPNDPTRAGYTFLGWYEDVSVLLTEQEYEEHKDELEDLADVLQVFDGKVMLRYEPESDPVYYDMEVQAQWALDPKAGLKTEVVLGQGAPTIKASNLDEVASGLVTPEELAQGVTVRLVVNVLDKSKVADTDKAALEATFKELGVTDHQWLDISLVKIVGGTQTKIETLKTPLKFTVETPKEMRADGRTYYLLRKHGGEVTAVASGKGTVLSAESDRFSTYVLAYKGSSGANPAQAAAAAPQQTTSRTTLAHTGDATPAFLSALLALMGSGALVAAAKRRR